MENWATQAVAKLERERTDVYGQKQSAMAGAVLAVLKDFCKQEPEFAQAVVEGGAFRDCMDAVAKGVGHSISDIDAYKKAVRFYFPGAKINVQMSIDLVGDAGRKSGQAPEDNAFTGLVLDLESFL